MVYELRHLQLLALRMFLHADGAEADDEQEERGMLSSQKERYKRREAKGNAKHKRARQSKHAATEISKVRIMCNVHAITNALAVM